MPHEALVIDDDPEVREMVAEILDSLGHRYDMATCQEEARELLGNKRYSYYLVDLEIPVRAGKGLPRIQNGENLIAEIVQQRGARKEPIIIITGHGKQGPALAVRMMKLGAADYVTKPFPPTGETLDTAIREALSGGVVEKAGGKNPASARAPSQPTRFQGGEMTFYPDRVEVCGVKVCGGRRAGLIRRILDVLRAKRPSGQYVAFSGAELGTEVGHRGDQNRIAGCIRDFRRNACQMLLDEAKVECGLQDIVRSGGAGYRLHEWIVVREGDGPHADKSIGDGVPVDRDNDPVNAGSDPVNAGSDPVNAGSDPVSVPVNWSRDPVNGLDDPVNRASDPVNGDWSDPVNRRHWIMAELRKGRQLRTPEIAARLGCSAKTIKRDMEAMRDAGQIEFVGPPKTGHYRLKAAAKPR